jgi:hypothetical protein
MMPRICRVFFWIGLPALLALGGCATDVLYASAQSHQKRECEKIIDTPERNRCVERVTVSQAEYKRQTDALKPAVP